MRTVRVFFFSTRFQIRQLTCAQTRSKKVFSPYSFVAEDLIDPVSSVLYDVVLIPDDVDVAEFIDSAFQREDELLANGQSEESMEAESTPSQYAPPVPSIPSTATTSEAAHQGPEVPPAASAANVSNTILHRRLHRKARRKRAAESQRMKELKIRDKVAGKYTHPKKISVDAPSVQLHHTQPGWVGMRGGHVGVPKATPELQKLKDDGFIVARCIPGCVERSNPSDVCTDLCLQKICGDLRQDRKDIRQVGQPQRERVDSPLRQRREEDGAGEAKHGV